MRFKSLARRYARLVSTGRNIFLGEVHDSRTYETIFKYRGAPVRVTVRTVMEMEVVTKGRRA